MSRPGEAAAMLAFLASAWCLGTGRELGASACCAYGARRDARRHARLGIPTPFAVAWAEGERAHGEGRHPASLSHLPAEQRRIALRAFWSAEWAAVVAPSLAEDMPAGVTTADRLTTEQHDQFLTWWGRDMRRLTEGRRWVDAMVRMTEGAPAAAE
jgi:hypothetical protein